MAFEKGMKKTGGRTSGSKNKKTLAAILLRDYILEMGIVGISDIWDELKAKDKMDFIIKMMPYQIPQMARIENESKVPQNITINMMPAPAKQIEDNIKIEDITHEEIDD